MPRAIRKHVVFVKCVEFAEKNFMSRSFNKEKEFNATILDPTSSVVIEACAGSGKTWLLVSRIIRLLLHGVSPSSILAVTFTKKAANEMRSRLDEWLKFLSVAEEGRYTGVYTKSAETLREICQ